MIRWDDMRWNEIKVIITSMNSIMKQLILSQVQSLYDRNDCLTCPKGCNIFLSLDWTYVHALSLNENLVLLAKEKISLNGWKSLNGFCKKYACEEGDGVHSIPWYYPIATPKSTSHFRFLTVLEVIQWKDIYGKITWRNDRDPWVGLP